MSSDKKRLFAKILKNPLNIDDSDCSKECIDLLEKLLDKDISKRITPKDIPNHPWFTNLNFDDIYRRKTLPKFIPQIKSIEDLSNIDPEFLNEEINSPIKKRRNDFEIPQGI